MSIVHYFSGNEDKRAKFIFNFIAPVYGLLDNAIEKVYSDMAAKLNEKIPVSGLSVLDIGSGTGAWLSAIHSHTSSKATGIDFSNKMVEVAKKRHPALSFVHGDAESLSGFAEGAYDIVTASFVLHGMKTEKRTKVLSEMKRVARKFVVIHDFYQKTPFVIRILEFLERSDYINFKKNFTGEMQNMFSKTELLPSNNGNALYIGFL